MNKKKLIFNAVLCGLSVVTLFIMFMPILTTVDITVFDLVKYAGEWVFMEEYLWGIAGLISTICLPLLVVSSVLGILSACGVIKCKKLDTVLYIVNIVLASLVVAVIVNYFLGLGRTIGMSGLKLFKGTTYFEYSAAFFYLHCVFSISTLVVAILNKNKKVK